MTTHPGAVGAARRRTLTLAGLAVGFAAADTYVVVLALPDMMRGVGLNIDELQRAAPIVSGFLLGYVAMLPLIGRVADLRGRVPVLVFSLLVFACGSLVTATAASLPVMVLGRFLQGLGGGGLVPATLALVADLWPPHRRGMPLGVVGAVQELGAVLGPLYGALVLALWPWPAIFWINLTVGLILAAAIAVTTGAARLRPLRSRSSREPGPAPDWVGGLLLLVSLLAYALLVVAPEALVSDLTLGLAWVPLAGDSVWTTPLAVLALAAVACFVVRELIAARPLVDLRAVAPLARSTDLLGASLLAFALAGIVLAFATADPQVAVLSPQGPWYLAAAAVAGAAFWWRQRHAAYPLVPRRALSAKPAWGSLAVSFFVGAALIAALVDVPVFARVTTESGSQLGAALVLLRFLVALPIGAIAGGWLVRRWPAGLVTAGGMAVSTGAFVAMTTWGSTSLDGPGATVALAACGLGFGLALAPVNAALLLATAPAVHGLSSALLVVARMVGMLVGISALTTIGLTRFYAVEASIPSPNRLCPRTPTDCPEYVALLREAGLTQLHTVFAGAAVCALVAGVLALVLLRGPDISGARSAGRTGALGYVHER
ncbi:MAG TPA: MFS transporter [Nocardioidaceae bacterium]|nr:MFS transporter [Nocardioidaceae bacterium]